MKLTYLLGHICVASLLVVACGGESEGGSASGGGGGSSAAGGSGGATAGASGSGSGGATGGSAGLSTGGTAGASSGGNSGAGGATGGTAGATGGTGGASGGSGGATGGTGGAVGAPECTQESDCKVLNDCCSCEGIPKTENPASCPSVCKQNTCEALGVSPTSVSCVAGRCVKGFDCDTSKVTCKAVEPTCPAGQVAEVKGSCYTFNCVAASECTFVPSCTKCAATDVCANYATQVGPRPHCVSVPTSCAGDFSCGCLGPSVCVAPFDSCNNLSGQKGVSCGCPVC